MHYTTMLCCTYRARGVYPLPHTPTPHPRPAPSRHLLPSLQIPWWCCTSVPPQTEHCLPATPPFCPSPSHLPSSGCSLWPLCFFYYLMPFNYMHMPCILWFLTVQFFAFCYACKTWHLGICKTCVRGWVEFSFSSRGGSIFFTIWHLLHTHARMTRTHIGPSGSCVFLLHWTFPSFLNDVIYTTNMH